MDYFDLILFGHLLAVVIWIGGGAMLQVLAFRARRAGPEHVVRFAADVEWVGTRVFVPASLAVVVFGFLLVDEIGYSLGDLWISVALAVYLFSFVLGAGFLGPESGRVAALAEERGAADEEVQRRLRRVFLLSRIELVLLILVILDMVVKPT